MSAVNGAKRRERGWERGSSFAWSYLIAAGDQTERVRVTDAELFQHPGGVDTSGGRTTFNDNRYRPDRSSGAFGAPRRSGRSGRLVWFRRTMTVD